MTTWTPRFTAIAVSSFVGACVSDLEGAKLHAEPDADEAVDGTAVQDVDPRADGSPVGDAETLADLEDDAKPHDADSEGGPAFNVFTGAFEFRPTLVYAIPTQLGFDLRMSAGVASCEEARRTLAVQDFNLKVVIDGEGEAIEPGFIRADEDFSTPPNPGGTYVMWVVIAVDTVLSAHSFSLEITERTPDRLRGHLEAEFEALNFAPLADLRTGRFVGDFDAPICDPDGVPR